MCGICGIIAREPITASQVAQMRTMNAHLVHRGPDDEGEFHSTHVALAMRRLSIIDLTGGQQPLFSENRSLVLIANGEIYNFVELRRDLQARGHLFRTGSDCETILHLYEDYGLDCVRYLRGMFVFALWDSNRERLLLARDRMGEKPLYLWEGDGQFIFASEMKSILHAVPGKIELDPVAVDLYFHYGYVLEPLTPIRGIRKLDAARVLTIHIEPWQISEQVYWRMEDAPALGGNPAELIRGRLEEVSEIVIRSDVPVGVALGGGLDSSAIAALAVRKYPETMHAFSVGYPGHPQSDEREDAKALAEYLGMPFHEVEISISEMVEFFPELNYRRDDPIADISGHSYYAVMKAAGEYGVPVMLQGQGGDELFWGYPEVQKAAIESVRKQRNLDKSGLALLADYVHPQDLQRPDRGLRAWKRWIRSVFGLREGWAEYQRMVSGSREKMIFMDLEPRFSFARAHIREFYEPAFAQAVPFDNACQPFTFSNPWPHIPLTLTKLIINTYLRENGITQGDRLGMASSVELRLPLLDHRLVETVVGLRKQSDDYLLGAKAWLRGALKGILPDWVLHRPKRGFSPPTDWTGAMLRAHESLFVDGYLVQTGLLDPSAVRKLWGVSFQAGHAPEMAYMVLVLEMWCRKMLA